MNIFTSENFDQEVLQSKSPVLVDFWASWCGPCQMMGPIMEDLFKEYFGQNIKIGKCNVDESSDLAEKYGILSIPAFLVFKSGEVVDQMIGGVSKVKLEELIGRNI
ncbi:MAG: thioredoxin [Candidatus Magasanikbacteria bacterium CG10_big_fil_rev_8_21_14_0_10_36_32]|uniref:Thioredoxin n=1 Tax=Candidatus Magasanikbacteria bacterium CG10_big_fil_rev_8_21_14_0_10_36_32 TaxID=1974646 RepID=A0A2M6W7D3_9BACT|nr:MAG: thioredoxin [Candidatus Magasanikbacteria bacterium CG10_big_fil_rev_8_21_14_0_10_36_32]